MPIKVGDKLYAKALISTVVDCNALYYQEKLYAKALISTVVDIFARSGTGCSMPRL